MSLIANESNLHLSPPLPHLVTTPTSTCHYASTYLPLISTQPITTPAPTCKHLSHSFFPTHAFHASRPCLSTFENMLFLPIEHALLVPWRGPSPTHLITFWFHVVYKLHSRRSYSSLLRELKANQCNDFLLAHCISSFKGLTSSDSSNALWPLYAGGQQKPHPQPLSEWRGEWSPRYPSMSSRYLTAHFLSVAG